jgi:hypothetical protein
MCDTWSQKWVFTLFVCAFSLGCDSDAQLRDDTGRFLAGYTAITYDLRGAELEKRIGALAALPLGEAEVREARDLCVAGHRAMLNQERAQEAHAAEVDRALAGSTDGAPLDTATLAGLKEKLDAAQTALTSAREQLERCEAQARSLAMRFGPR